MSRKCFMLAAVGLLLGLEMTRAQEEFGPNTLTRQEKDAGKLLLFDGESTFGWQVEGDVREERGVLILGGTKPTTATIPLAAGTLFWDFLWQAGVNVELKLKSSDVATEPWELAIPWTGSGVLGENNWRSEKLEIQLKSGKPSLESLEGSKAAKGKSPSASFRAFVPSLPTLLEIKVGAGYPLRLRNIKLQPAGLEPLFDGKTLGGWREFKGEKYTSKFTVTPEGWLNVKNGPGDLQTERTFGNFLFQGDCISNGKALNSGIFFRCVPGYQQGYEYQIQNGFKDGDRKKPADFGTGAIYRRTPARKVIPNDQQWFTMTLLAYGNHFRTWVDGYPVVDWTDTRKPEENARQGFREKAGHLSIQGHDPTTDLSFRNLRAVELKK